MGDDVHEDLNTIKCEVDQIWDLNRNREQLVCSKENQLISLSLNTDEIVTITLNEADQIFKIQFVRDSIVAVSCYKASFFFLVDIE